MLFFPLLIVTNKDQIHLLPTFLGPLVHSCSKCRKVADTEKELIQYLLKHHNCVKCNLSDCSLDDTRLV